MDQFLISLDEIAKSIPFSSGRDKLKKSEDLIDFCIKYKKVAKISTPQQIPKKNRGRYLTHLVSLVENFLDKNQDILSWEKFKNHPENGKIHSILFKFGVPGEIDFEKRKDPTGPIKIGTKNLTITEFYEMVKIRFNFQGTESAFKRHIQKIYGSFSEYCIEKGYDINTHRWESKETALRCAKKLGSLRAIRKRSRSLYDF